MGKACLAMSPEFPFQLRAETRNGQLLIEYKVENPSPPDRRDGKVLVSGARASCRYCPSLRVCLWRRTNVISRASNAIDGIAISKEDK